MSVDFASEAPRCQRISSITPQITFDQRVIGGFSQGVCGAGLFALPLADPSGPPRNIQIRPRNHGGIYWIDKWPQGHRGEDGPKAVAPRRCSMIFEFLAVVYRRGSRFENAPPTSQDRGKIDVLLISPAHSELTKHE